MQIQRAMTLAAAVLAIGACARSQQGVESEPMPAPSTTRTPADSAAGDSTTMRDTTVTRDSAGAMSGQLSSDTSSQVSSDTSGQTTVEPSSQTAAQPSAGAVHWSGTLAPKNGSTVSGTAMAMPGDASGQTQATVQLSGAEPNSVHPWHVHTGNCASPGGIVGPASAYQPVTVDATGSGSSNATVPVATPSSGEYSVNVHKSASEMTIIACADLATGTH